MVTLNSNGDLLGEEKIFAKNDTSYSSFWLFNKERDINSLHFKDSFVNFYDNKVLLSEFNPAIAKNIISFWSEPNDIILDPFSGRSRALISFAMNRRYIGYEISKDAYTHVLEEFNRLGFLKDEKFMQDIILKNKDCIYAHEEYDPESIDLIFTCPPYWNLEKYESCYGQLSDLDDYNIFLQELYNRLLIASEKLKVGKYMILVVGDFRKNAKLTTFHSDLIQKMRNLPDFVLHDIIAIQNIPFYTAAFYFGAVKHKKFTAKAHEYILVWKKL